jgi:hypothetical protein
VLLSCRRPTKQQRLCCAERCNKGATRVCLNGFSTNGFVKSG